MIKIQREDIDIEEILESVKSPASGGVAKMSIEVYEEMALKQLGTIESEAREKFGVHEIAVVHRYGDLEVGDNIVFIAVAAGHREEAFKACKYVIDELKQRVPIWKKETTPEGKFWVEGERHE